MQESWVWVRGDMKPRSFHDFQGLHVSESFPRRFHMEKGLFVLLTVKHVYGLTHQLFGNGWCESQYARAVDFLEIVIMITTNDVCFRNLISDFIQSERAEHFR